MRRGWQTRRDGGAGGSAGWTRALAFAGMLAGVAWALAWALRERRHVDPRAASRSPAPAPSVGAPVAPAPTGTSTPPPPALESAPPSSLDEPAAAQPAASAAAAPSVEVRVALTELWVLNGEVRGTLANEGDAPVGAVTWAMRLVPGYDADNDYGGEPPPVIEVSGGHDGPIDAGGTAVVTLAEAPAWYLDVQLHPMQLRARYRVEDEAGALQESEQSARLILFHVHSEGELDDIREQYLR